MTQDPRWTADNLALLVGHTITGTFLCPDEEFCGFETTAPDGEKFRTWVDADTEGNRCGSVAVHKEDGTRVYPERGKS